MNITPKPLYRVNTNTNSVLSIQQPQPLATTYRPPTAHFITQKPVHVTAPSFTTKGISSNFGSSTRGSIDFDAEFKKFQHENNFQSVTASPGSQQPSKGVKLSQKPSVTTGNPIYQSQLVYNPATGQYDSNLYQSIGSEGDFQLNQRIQPYQQQYQIPQQEQRPQFSLQNSPLYRPVPQNVQPQQQVPQQIYQKQQNEMQFVNSQQLFAQQLEMQQNQLHRDRIEAAKKHTVSPAHRFQLQQQQQAQQQQQFGVQSLRAQQQPQQQQAAGQQFYYLQPNAQQSSGQIDAFLRGHNLEY